MGLGVDGGKAISSTITIHSAIHGASVLWLVPTWQTRRKDETEPFSLHISIFRYEIDPCHDIKICMHARCVGGLFACCQMEFGIYETGIIVKSMWINDKMEMCGDSACRARGAIAKIIANIYAFDWMLWFVWVSLVSPVCTVFWMKCSVCSRSFDKYWLSAGCQLRKRKRLITRFSEYQ